MWDISWSKIIMIVKISFAPNSHGTEVIPSVMHGPSRGGYPNLSMEGGLFFFFLKRVENKIYSNFKYNTNYWNLSLTTSFQAVGVSVQFSSVTQSCPTLCDPVDYSTPGLPVHHQLPEFTQTHVHWVGDAIQPPHPLSSLSPPTLNLSQHRGLFKWVSSSHEVAKVLEFQLWHFTFVRVYVSIITNCVSVWPIWQRSVSPRAQSLCQSSKWCYSLVAG